MSAPSSIFATPLTVDGEIRLKLVEVGDAKELFELTDANRVYLRQWLPWVDSTKSIQSTIDFIEISRRAAEQKTGASICIRYQGKIAGVVGFHLFDWANRSTSMGYWLGEHLQGRGIVSRSCTELVDRAFSGLKLNRVEIRCANANAHSRAIPERMGFVNEGIIHDGEWLYDKYVDLVVYGMLARHWHHEPGT